MIDRRGFLLGLNSLLAPSVGEMRMEFAERDQFGGWRGVKAASTGYFRTAKVGGGWWLITPEGSGFFSKGVCHVSFEGDHSPALGHSPYRRAVETKYGSRPKWASETAKRMRGWGLNTAGAWSEIGLSTHGIAYTPILDLAAKSVPD